LVAGGSERRQIRKKSKKKRRQIAWVICSNYDAHRPER
jgi:hypothetical protein